MRSFWVIGSATGILLASLLGAAVADAEAPYRFETTAGRLAKTALPTAYRIELRPDAAAATFTANEEIDVNVAQQTSTLTLNSIGLNIRSAALTGGQAAAAEVTVDPSSETVTLHFSLPLTVGRHTLKLAYSGPITSQPAGLYFNDYQTPAGRRRMLVTQFEATDARRMFPGWDEPVFKATFRLSVIVPRNQTALSNTPVASVEPAGKDRRGVALKKVTFATTPSMSTYLVALVVGELRAVRQTVAGVEISAWAAGGKAAQGRVAVRAAAELLPYFNDYFGIDYPLAKLDLIAVPGNFDAGAMENWGAITFIDDALLFDPKSSSEATRADIYASVAHEMAHQWSGDLVTMAWWDNLWLNEGFAAWMEAKATDHLQPDWRIWLQANADKERAMAADALSTAHAVQARVENDSDVKTLFDEITYLKGEHLIHMLETYLGEDVFRAGMRVYMKQHAYSNATTADLWKALETASGKPVARIAASFTEQPGVPLVNVTSACTSGRTELELTQERFTVHDPTATPLSWQIPVIAGPVGAGDMAQAVVLGDTPQHLSFAGCDAPIKVNLDNVGYYRVAYDEHSLSALRAGFARLTAADRVSLLGDQWALVVAGRAAAPAYLDLLRGLSEETELVVWTQVLATLRQLDQLERGVATQPEYRVWARRIVRPLLDRVGWQPRAGERREDGLLRGDAVASLGELGDPQVLAESRRRFGEFRKHPASLDPNLRDAVLTNVGRQARTATFNELRALGRQATGTEEKLRYFGALSCAQDPAFVPQIVAMALSDDVSPARVTYMLNSAARCGPDPDALWQEVLRHQDALLARVSEDRREHLLADVAAASATPAVAQQLLAQRSAAASSGAVYEARKAAEGVAARAELRERVLPQVHAWLHAAKQG